TSPIWIADEGKTVTPSPGRVGEVEGGGFEPTAVVSPALPLRPSSNRTDGFPIFGSPSPVRFTPLGREPKSGLMMISSWRLISLRSHRPPSLLTPEQVSHLRSTPVTEVSSLLRRTPTSPATPPASLAKPACAVGWVLHPPPETS